MKRLIPLCCLLCTLCLSVGAQQLAKYEYWIDNYAYKVSGSMAGNTFCEDIDVSGLHEGAHLLMFRAQDDQGNWSAPVARLFMKYGTEATHPAREMTRYEYWIDDYASKVSGSMAGNIFSAYIDVSNLSDGEHLLVFRAQDDQGNWSAPIFQVFTRQPFTRIPLDEGDWNIIVGIRNQLVKQGWEEPWDTSLGIEEVYSFKGLALHEGHVIGINLSGNHLKGDIPWDVFKLPCLTSLDLSDNDFSGDIGSGMQIAMETGSCLTDSLKTVNISNNNLSGNIALFANNCPALQILDASRNRISEVSPMISPNVTTLNLSWQDIDKTMDIDLASLNPTATIAEMPTILLYDHEKQTYRQNLNLLCTVADIEHYDINTSHEWGMKFQCSNEAWSIPAVSPWQNEYNGESGDVLNVMNLKANNTKEGSTVKMRLHFAMGDANFTGNVDVTDLQAIISRIFGNYGSKPFNHTSANTVKDDVLNVQDVVGEVNLLLSNDVAAAPRHMAKATGITGESTAEASVYCNGNELKIYTSVPIAAFDIIVDNASSLSVCDAIANLGLTCAVRETAAGAHIIGYSLNGASLPAGETSVASFCGNDAAIRYAVLSDKEATAISVDINAMPTSIRSTDMAPPRIEAADGKLYVITNGSGNDVSWTVSALDGKILDKGLIPGRTSGRNVIDLDAGATVIVKLKSDNFKLTRKITSTK